MKIEDLNFNNLPQAVGTLIEQNQQILARLEEMDIQSSKEPHFMNIEQVAEFTGLAIPTIYSKCSRKEIPHIKKGKHLRFVKTDIIQWLESGKVATDAELLNQIKDETNGK